MSFELVREESFGENVRRLACQRLGKVFDALSAPSPDARAIHGSRRNLKKLRALLRLARAGLGEDTFARENTCYRDAARTLSAARDAEVLVQAFDDLRGEIGNEASAQTLDGLRQSLLADAQGSAVTLQTNAGGGLPETLEALRHARARIDQWRWHGRENAWSVPGQGVKTAYRRGRRAMGRAAEQPSEADFHEWRKQVKHLAYQARLLRPIRRRKLKTLGRKLDALAELLGEEHDLSVLAVKVAERQIASVRGEQAAADDAVVGRHIESHRRWLQQEALALGRGIFREKPARFVARLENHWGGGARRLGRAGRDQPPVRP